MGHIQSSWTPCKCNSDVFFASGFWQKFSPSTRWVQCLTESERAADQTHVWRSVTLICSNKQKMVTVQSAFTWCHKHQKNTWFRCPELSTCCKRKPVLSDLTCFFSLLHGSVHTPIKLSVLLAANRGKMGTLTSLGFHSFCNALCVLTHFSHSKH